MIINIIILIFHTFFYVNSMTTYITFAKNNINIIIVFVCGYQSASFKTANNTTTLQHAVPTKYF